MFGHVLDLFPNIYYTASKHINLLAPEFFF